ncbi:MAG: ADP-ribosylglycohydrolase family protein [Armatimonadetes bacterium]|nr:ADP-ribosylglycohydrolase family protein [Armatimonadota bacterium]
MADATPMLCWTSTYMLEFATLTEDALGSRESSRGEVALGGRQVQTRGRLMITLTEADYRQRVYGGWLGKVIGAAVGVPSDTEKQAQEVAGYPERLAHSTTVTTEGIDLQLVWLRALQSVGTLGTTDQLISAWLRHVRHSHGEYPYALANFRRDVPPPLSGVLDNPYRESLGALARADLWGMLAPGDPEQAAWFARRDAMLDHATAGMEAAIWLAGVVSASFVEREVPKLIHAGLALIPEDGKPARALRDVTRWHGEHANWERTREMLLRSYSSEDVRDSTVAVGFIALALLHGRRDFARSVVTAAWCGWSTGCSCSSVGAVLGVLLGAEGLPADWRELSPKEVAAGWGVVGLPRTIPCPTLAEQTTELGRLVVCSECSGRVQLLQEPPEEPPKLPSPEATELLRQLAMGPYVVSYRRGPLRVQVDYDMQATIGYDAPRRLTVALTNTTNRSLDVQTRLSAPAGFVITTTSQLLSLPEATSVSFMVTCNAPREHARLAVVNPCTLFLSVEDGAELTVPITFVGEAIWYLSGPYEGFEEPHAPEQPGVLSGETALGGEGWRELSVAEPMTNILAGVEGEQGTYYAATDIFSPRAMRTRLQIGCNDATRAWLNGKEVLVQHEHRPVSPLSADEVEAEIREGWNRIAIKMGQCSPRRFLSFALKDEQGQMLIEGVSAGGRTD